MDYGNEDTVGLSSVRNISQELCKLPAQAMHCSHKGSNTWKTSIGESFGALAMVSISGQCLEKIPWPVGCQCPLLTSSWLIELLQNCMGELPEDIR